MTLAKGGGPVVTQGEIQVQEALPAQVYGTVYGTYLLAAMVVGELTVNVVGDALHAGDDLVGTAVGGVFAVKEHEVAAHEGREVKVLAQFGVIADEAFHVGFVHKGGGLGHGTLQGNGRVNGIEVRHAELVEVGTRTQLGAEPVDDLVAGEEVAHDAVLDGGVAHVIDGPVGVDTVDVAAVPVHVLAVLVLIAFSQPLLVNVGSQADEAEAHVVGGVGKGGTVGYLLHGVVDTALEAEALEQFCTGLEHDGGAAHAGSGNNVAVAHVGQGQEEVALVVTGAHGERIGKGGTGAEEAGNVVGHIGVGHLTAIVDVAGELLVELGAPGALGNAAAHFHGERKFAVTAGAVHALVVVELGKLVHKVYAGREVNVETLLAGRLGGDEDDTVGSAGAVEGCGRCSLQDGDGLDVLRANAGEAVTHVVATPHAGLSQAGVIHGNAVHYI